MGTLPDFLVIGAQKCGTTWLHECLARHPRITMPAGKDGGFFCYRATRTEEALASYAAQYPDTLEAGSMRGESTAAYFWTVSGSKWDRKPDGFESSIPERIRETLGDATRLLLCLRNPVDRAVSAWFHHVRQGDLSPEEPLLEAGGYAGLIDMGFYAQHLRNWLKAYPPENFCILIMEDDIARRPAMAIRRVYRFLGVQEAFLPPQLHAAVYAGSARRRTREGIHATIDGTSERLIIDRRTLGQLTEIYRDDVRELESLLCRDVRDIWGF